MADDGSSEMIEIDLAEWKKLKVFSVLVLSGINFAVMHKHHDFFC